MVEVTEHFTFEGDLDDVQAWFLGRRLTDGLPIIPPTENKVQAMLRAIGAGPQESLGEMPPRWGSATYETIAANAVMAGCRPEAFPVIVTAVKAMLCPQFNLYGLQATTHPVAPMVIVHGPLARELGVNGTSGALGPGFPTNASIGRAIRLILMNVGGAFPGEADRSTQGGPAKYSYCFTENVEESPWPEFHAVRGLSTDQSAVTVFGGESPHNVNDHESTTPTRLLDITADTMRALGHNNWYLAQDGLNDFVVLFGPEHAETIASAGWTREDVQNYLYRRAVRSARDLAAGGMWDMRDWPAWIHGFAQDADAAIPLVRRPEDLLVLVVGGPGKHSAIIPGFGASRSVTMAVD